MDVVLLSRLQFALTIMFHYLFPPLTIGMSVVLVYLEGMHLKTREPIYETAAKFWTSLFAVTFAVGVATGVVMEFQFGTNWAGYSRFVGDVFGSALAAEGIFAFFLESGFLAVLVFGWNKVGARFHFVATALVAFGSIFSAVWIVVANSWQQTPAGHHMVAAGRSGTPGANAWRAEILDFGSVVLNPSSMARLAHVLIAAFILGAFFIMSISAYYILKGRHLEFAKRSFSGALLFATVASVAAVFSGDVQARIVARHQPAKMAAFEAVYETGPADLSLFGIPDEEEERLRLSLGVPRGLSLLLYYDADAPVVGLDKFRREDRPPVFIPFATYHLMIALGVFFVGITLLASYLRLRKRLFEKRWLMWIFVFAVALPFINNEVGWVAAEVGRQPWVVHPPVAWEGDGGIVVGPSGLVEYDAASALRTRDAVSESVRSSAVVTSIIFFALIYAFLFALWILLLDRRIREGPQPVEPPGGTTAAGLLSAAGARAEHWGSMTDAHTHRDEEER